MINPSSLHFGDVIYPPGGMLGPRQQQTYELVLIYHGSMTLLLDGVPLTAEANSTTLLFPGHEECFSFDKNSETHHAWVHLALPDLAKNVAERLTRLPPVISLSTPMRTLMNHLLDLRTCTLPTAQEMMKNVAAQMLWRYIGEAEENSLRKQDKLLSTTVERVQDYIYLHLHEELTLHHLTQVGAISPAHLTRLFRTQVGLPPLEYVWQQRVKRGVEMLEHTGLTVEQIALRCGFKTSYHFSRRIKDVTGRTPSEVRRQAGNVTLGSR